MLATNKSNKLESNMFVILRQNSEFYFLFSLKQKYKMLACLFLIKLILLPDKFFFDYWPLLQHLKLAQRGDHMSISPSANSYKQQTKLLKTKMGFLCCQRFDYVSKS